jgi:hypothetical protein
VRYQYRIGGDECVDDFFFPAMINCAASCAASFGIICLPCVLGFFSYFVAVVMKILKESEVQLKARGGVPGFYLSSPPASEMNDNRTVFPSTAVYASNDHVTVPADAQYVSYNNNNNEVMSPIYVNNHGVVATPTTVYPAVSVPHNQVPTVVILEYSNPGSKNI